MSSRTRDTQELGSRLNDDMVRMTKYLLEIGPNVNEIARRSGQFKESVRYRYRKLILEKGFAIQAIPNYSKLGLGRLIMITKFAPQFDSWANMILSAMSELCYLHSYTRTILEGRYVVHVTVPLELQEECISLYEKFLEMGLFSELEIHRFGEVRNAPMKPEYYDFDNGNWDFDWPSAEVIPHRLGANVKQEVEKYDKVDLLILKELDKDATKTLIQISNTIDISQKTVGFHYLKHVRKRGLVRGYRLTWQGAKYDFGRDKLVIKPHRYVDVGILLVGATDGERAELTSLVNRTPFLWFEASEPYYYAELFVPTNSYVEFLMYLKDLAEKVGTRMRLFLFDQTNGLRFTIAYQLFDKDSRKWLLNSSDIISKFQNLLVSINSGEI